MTSPTSRTLIWIGLILAPLTIGNGAMAANVPAKPVAKAAPVCRCRTASHDRYAGGQQRVNMGHLISTLMSMPPWGPYTPLYVDEWELIQKVQHIGQRLLARTGVHFPPRWPVV